MMGKSFTWFLFASLLLVGAFAGALAGPVEADPNNNGDSSGWKTYHALKNFFQPVTNYFKGLPTKTPDDVATDISDKATDIKDWIEENKAIQTLLGSLRPVKDWVKEKSDVLQDKTFKEMYEDVKTRVSALDEKIGQWIQERNNKELH